MGFGRKDDLALAADAFSVSTDLKGGDQPAVETLVTRRGAVVSRTSTAVQDLRPFFNHVEEILGRINTQHEAVLEKLKRGELALSVSKPGREGPPHLEARLEKALAFFGSNAYDKAIAGIRQILDIDPEFTEARQLLEIAYAARSMEIPPVATAVERLQTGAEAFAEGRSRKAIEHWKDGLLAEPSNRLFQLLVLIASTGASPAAVRRRKRYVEEVLSIGQKLLAQGRTAEAYSLFLIAQSAEPGASASTVEATVVEAGPPETPRESGSEEARPFAEAEPTRAESEPLFAETIFAEPEPAAGHAPDTAIPLTPAEADPLPSAEAHLATPSRADPATPGQAHPAPSQAEPATPSRDSASIKPGFEARSEGEATVLELAGLETAPAVPESLATPPPAPEPSGPGGPQAAAPSPTAPAKTGFPAKPARSLDTRAPDTRTYRGPRPVPHRGLPAWIPYAGLAALALVGLGVFYFLSGKDGAEADPLEEAAGLLTSGKYDQAVSAYTAVLARQGELAPAYLGRGRARLASGDTLAGLADLVRAVELAPDTPGLAEELAGALFTRGDFAEAARRYRELLASGRDTVEVRHRLAASLGQLGRTDEALTHLQAALGSGSAPGEVRFLYAKMLNARGRHAEAERALREAKAQFDPGVDYFPELGISLVEQGKVEEAEAVARDFARQNPDDARSRSLLGDVFLRKGQLERARDQLIAALTANPADPRAQIALGRTWLAIGEARGDKSDLAKARQILIDAKGVPEGQRLLVLGQVSLAEGNPGEAVSLIEQSLRQGAPALPARLSLAGARFTLKDLAGTTADLQQAAALAPSDPAVLLSLGLVYAQQRDWIRAAEHFLKALRAAGLAGPPEKGRGPVVLPRPYIPLPARFDVTRAIRSAYQQALAANKEDPNGLALKSLAESASFVFSEKT